MGKAFLALVLMSSSALAAAPTGGAAAGNSSGAAAGHSSGTHIQSVRAGATADKPRPKPKPVPKSLAPSPEVHNVVPARVLTPCTTERRLRHECGEGPSHLR